MSHLHLALLGGFQAHLDDQPLEQFASNKVRALLVYLVLEAERAHDRSQLAGLFWPEWKESAARTNLRHALSNLRKLLNDQNATPPFLFATRQNIQFNVNASFSVDALSVAAAAVNAPVTERGRRVAALLTYRTPLLWGFSLDGCPEFENWLLLARERLQQQVMDGLNELAQQAERESDLQQALHLAQRAVELEPWREEAHRNVMRLLARRGQRGAALAQYDRCVALLNDELGVEPDDETVALYHQIVSGKTVSGKTVDGKRVEGKDSGNAAGAASKEVISLHKPSALAGEEAGEDDTAGKATPVSTSRSNFPAQVTPLVGRKADVDAVRSLFHEDGARLITLTGPGGVGKTRLALEVSEQLAGERYWIPLVAMRESGMVLSAMAEALEIPHAGSRPLLKQLQDALHHRRVWLVLDNFEHVLDAAPMVAKLLASCPSVKFLITSRERLSIMGEYEYVTLPLALPQVDIASASMASASIASANVDSAMASMLNSPAVELFYQRARAANHAFMPEPANIQAVSSICTRLDGLPLAIELAAARLKYYSIQSLLQRLNTQNDQSTARFLTNKARDRSSRHWSLWDTIAWSYTLLDEVEQPLFLRLSTFVGGWTLAGAEAVCVDCPRVIESLLDLMMSLVDKSLVRPIPVEDAKPGVIQQSPRFTMLETIREFGLEELQRLGEKERVQKHHANFYLACIETAHTHLETADQNQWLLHLDTERANLHAAFEWAVRTSNAEIGLRLGALMPLYWMRRTLNAEAFSRLDALLQKIDVEEQSAPVEDVLYYAGLFAGYKSDTERRGRYFLDAARASRRLGNKYRLSYSLALLNEIAYAQGKIEEARQLMSESLALAREVDDTFGIAMCLIHQGRHLAEYGDPIAGRPFTEEGMALHRQIGDKWGLGLACYCLNHVALAEGCLAESKAICGEMLRLAEEMSHEEGIIDAFFESAWMHLAMQEWEAATEKVLTVLVHYAPQDRDVNSVRALVGATRIFAHYKEWRYAFAIGDTIYAFLHQKKMILPPYWQNHLDELNTVRATLSGEHLAAANNTTKALDLNEAISLAITELKRFVS